MQLVIPKAEHLPEYISALRRGWSPDNLHPEAAQKQIAAITRDADAFLDAMDDPEAKGGPVRLPDGSTVPRLPSIRRWIWLDGFCGSIGFRWQHGTEDLPPTCSGHIGYAVVPWRQGKGMGTAALRAILPEARAKGLRYVEVTTDPDNVASRRVIEKSGGTLVETFCTSEALGSKQALRFRIMLT